MSKKNTKKLVTIGDAQVGKSSLLYRITHNLPPNVTSATIGAAFFSKNLKSCRLNMWDTAGQERFRAMVPIYLRDTDVIFFVYDVTDLKSFSHLKDYWIQFALLHSMRLEDSHSHSHSQSQTYSLPQLPRRTISSTPNEIAKEIAKERDDNTNNNNYCTPKDGSGPFCILIASCIK